jgi:hypothetical protein
MNNKTTAVRIIPVPGRDVMVQAWYQGGISVFDFTDAAHPREIAFFDRGPINATRMVGGGSWSVYWYNGVMVSSEIARGLDVFELTPSPRLLGGVGMHHRAVTEYPPVLHQPCEQPHLERLWIVGIAARAAEVVDDLVVRCVYAPGAVHQVPGQLHDGVPLGHQAPVDEHDTVPVPAQVLVAKVPVEQGGPPGREPVGERLGVDEHCHHGVCDIANNRLAHRPRVEGPECLENGVAIDRIHGDLLKCPHGEGAQTRVREPSSKARNSGSAVARDWIAQLDSHTRVSGAGGLQQQVKVIRSLHDRTSICHPAGQP